ncbi:hypothetical protein [Brevibacillus dissolubilis]|uniref:hypothetical protein n=1 Tax=Brevibacillus dissolubilis TaxID=1844116 RepID=UPI001115CD95|nr:hypothetical protein [Brevibacillus dissolubilis]
MRNNWKKASGSILLASLVTTGLVMPIDQTFAHGDATHTDATHGGVDQAAQAKEHADRYDDRIQLETKLGEFTKAKTNGKWSGKLDINVKIKETTDKDVTLTYELKKLNEDKTGEVAVLAPTHLFKKQLKEKQEKSSIDLADLEPGFYQVSVTATSKQNDADLWYQYAPVFLTVDAEGVQTGWATELPTMVQGVKGEEVKDEATVAPAAVTPEAVTAYGYWMRYDRAGVAAPVRNAKVEVLYLDASNVWRVLATTYTGSNGYYSVSYTPPASFTDAQVRVLTTNTGAYGQVQNDVAAVYGVTASYSAKLTTGGDAGTWYSPKGSNSEKALWVFDDLVKTKDALKSYKDPGLSTIVWYPTATNGAYYTRGGTIKLGANSPSSISVTAHELGHNYMYNLYNGSYPTTNCPSPHYITRTTNDLGCAWSEGWADFLQAYVNNNPRYYYDATSFTDLENTSTMDSGDMVEGRVAGAMWDLVDTVADGTDTRLYAFGDVYKAMYYSKRNNFPEYWTQWKTLGFDINAKYSLQQNTINYN